jgi:hypothetical protein
MKRTVLLIVAMIGAVIVLVSGVALAQDTTLPFVTQPPTQSLTGNTTLSSSKVRVKLMWYATDYDGAIARYELVDLDAFVAMNLPEQPPPSVNPVLVGAGDIASCSRTADEATAALRGWFGDHRADNIYATPCSARQDFLWDGGTESCQQRAEHRE